MVCGGLQRAAACCRLEKLSDTWTHSWNIGIGAALASDLDDVFGSALWRGQIGIAAAATAQTATNALLYALR